MALQPGDRENFKTLLRAARSGDLALMECSYTAGGSYVAVLCAVGWDGQEYILTPLAKLFSGDPYQEVTPPMLQAPGEGGEG